MGIKGYALAVGLGYVLGHPEGRARVERLGRQLAGRPEVAQAQEQGRRLVGQAVDAVKQRNAPAGATPYQANEHATATPTAPEIRP